MWPGSLLLKNIFGLSIINKIFKVFVNSLANEGSFFLFPNRGIDPNIEFTQDVTADGSSRC